MGETHDDEFVRVRFQERIQFGQTVDVCDRHDGRRSG